MHRGYPADARLCRLASSLVAGLTSADGRRSFMPGPLRLPRLNPSRRWVFYRLRQLAAEGYAVQTIRGYWRTAR